MEVWKDIEGYEGLYQVSNLGRVRSLNYNHTDKEEILKPCFNHNGYLRVGLCKNGKRKPYRVHRLVGDAFVPGRTKEKCFINHIDKNRANNRADNLEWCTCQYNGEYSCAKSIVQFDKQGNYITHYKSAISASRITGIAQQNICSCLKQKQKSTGNYTWQYTKDFLPNNNYSYPLF